MEAGKVVLRSLTRKGASLALAAFATLAVALAVVPSAHAATAVESANAWDNNYSMSGYPYASSTVNSYLTMSSSGNPQRVEYVSGTGLVVEEYDSDYNILSSKVVSESTYEPSDLSGTLLWGGFFAGESYNFVVAGQKNSGEDDGLCVVRVTKYTKDWAYVDSCEVSGINTTVPFDAGSLRMAESGTTLTIRTSHQMYASSDGKNHQSNMTLVVDEGTMKCMDGFWGTGYISNSYGYVSHSFNQFICELGGTLYAADHGDAYLRAMSLKKLGSTGSSSYTQLLDISGETGANYTYASLGGLESSSTKNTLLAVGSSADQDAIAEGTSGGSLVRNVWLTATSSDLGTTKTVDLTSYSQDGGASAGNPVLVKVGEDKFLVMWGVSSSPSTASSTSCTTINYVFVDGGGNLLTSVKSATGCLSDCQPVVQDGKVVWYVTGEVSGSKFASSAPAFYAIDTSTYEFTCSNPLSLAAVTFENSSYTYTGSAIEPSATVSIGDATLVAGTDYTLSYANNVNAGTATVVVTGKGGYSGTKEESFTIKQVGASGIGYTTISSCPYTGSAIQPKPTFTYNGMTLVEGTDYALSYSNNEEVGTASVKATFMGNYSGSRTIYFTITRASLAASMFTVDTSAETYTGSVVTKEVSSSLAPGTDYALSYSNNVNAGTATITITGMGNYTGTLKYSFTIECASVTIPSVVSDLVYDGAEQTGVSSDEGYAVTNGSATDAGSYTATATLDSNHQWSDGTTSTKTLAWTIAPRSLSSCGGSVTAISGTTYTGEAIEPVLRTFNFNARVVSGNVEWYQNVDLVEGQDYTVTYANNVNVGTAAVTYEGIGNFTGEVVEEFSIAAKSLSASDVSASLAYVQATYSGSALEPAVTVSDETGALVEGVDYSVTYRDNAAVGTGYAVVTGMGNFEGTIEISFAIVAEASDPGDSGSGGSGSGTSDGSGSGGSSGSDGSDTGGSGSGGSSDEDGTSFLFPDVQDPETYYYDAVYYLADLGLMTGYSEGAVDESGRDISGYFGVGRTLARAELVTVLWRYSCPEEAVSYDASSATDRTGLVGAADSMYYTEAVNWAYENGVITGFIEDGVAYLRPWQAVNFDQMATMLARLLGGQEAESFDASDMLADAALTDAASVETWARSCVAWCLDTGLVGGYDNKDGTYTLKPLEDVGRERAARIFYNAFQAGLM